MRWRGCPAMPNEAPLCYLLSAIFCGNDNADDGDYRADTEKDVEEPVWQEKSTEGQTVTSKQRQQNANQTNYQEPESGFPVKKAHILSLFEVLTTRVIVTKTSVSGKHQLEAGHSFAAVPFS